MTSIRIKNTFNLISENKRRYILNEYITKKGLLFTPNMRFVQAVRVGNMEFLNFLNNKMTVLCDSWLLYIILKGKKTRYPGSIFFSDFLRATNNKKVFLFGGDNNIVLGEAVKFLTKEFPSHDFSGVSPDFGFEKDKVLLGQYLNSIKSESPDVLVVGLGMPKQEVFINSLSMEGVEYIMPLGSTINAWGSKTVKIRKLLNTVALEWLFRLLLQPRLFIIRKSQDLLNAVYLIKVLVR